MKIDDGGDWDGVGNFDWDEDDSDFWNIEWGPDDSEFWAWWREEEQ
jgi:hypothetical protein